MGEHDVKTKPKATPKMVVKSKGIAVNAVKDKATVMKDVAVKKAIESKLGTEQQEQQPQKADTQAAETVENTAYTVTDTTYQKGKSAVDNKIKHRIENRVKNKETKECLKGQSEKPTPKTKEKYIQNETRAKEGVVNTDTNTLYLKSRTEARKEYVQNKLEKQNTENVIQSQVKTKETYMEQLSRERVEPRKFSSKAPKQNTHEVMRSKTNNKYAVKTRETLKKSNIKRGSVYEQNQ